MNKPLLVIVIIMALVTLFLCGCNEEQNDLDRFVGVWEGELSTYIFNSNRTCKIGTFNGTYTLEDETLIVNLDEGPIQGPISYYFAFSNNDTTLTLTEVSLGITAVYIKQ
jgi:hypothetical protein